MKLTYRADIDGLRAIAVLAVVLNHAGIFIFSGGFVGVDVFFVISGYLITNIIVREIALDEFSLIKFYERRIRRIYPALFVVLLFTLGVSAILYDSENFMAFSKSVIATTFFFSNIHFWTETGYFEKEAQLKPLLHTWSLAVEEQYYIFFPFFVMLISRYLKPRILYVLIGMALLSFSWDIYELQIDPSAAFYFAHLRAWELLIGSVLALNLVPLNATSRLRNALSWIGLGMILAPIFLYSQSVVFPGFAAAIPAIGTALIIYSGIETSTLVNKLLSFPLLVFVGQISYSLYLWHWPLIKFTTYYSIEKLTRLERVLLLVVIFIVSALSWQFIEKPFRIKKLQKRFAIFLYAAAAMAVTGTIGYFIYFNNGFPNQENLEQASYQRQAQTYGGCDFTNEANGGLLKFCPLGASMPGPTFLLWGDSHAGAQAKAIYQSASQQGVAGLLAFGSGCPSLIGINTDKNKDCVDFSDLTIAYIKDHQNIHTIFLANRWAYYVEGIGYQESTKIKLIDTLADKDTNAILVQRALTRTVEQLLALHRTVIIVSQVPEVKYDVPSAFYIAQRTGRDINQIISPTMDEYLARNKKVFFIINSISKNNNIQVIDPWKALCNESQCNVVVDKTSLYMDSTHLSFFGSQYISHIYDSLFKELVKTSN